MHVQVYICLQPRVCCSSGESIVARGPIRDYIHSVPSDTGFLKAMIMKSVHTISWVVTSQGCRSFRGRMTVETEFVSYFVL